MHRYLIMAMGVALTSKARMKHGAVVVRHSKVIGVSPNIVKNNPHYVDWRHSSIHAEVAAMKRAGWPSKCTVYVARVNTHGQPRYSRPCANCQEVLDSYRCKVVFT